MKLLITGGAGFMGSNFIHYLLNNYPDYQIVNFDKLTYAGNLDNLSHVENNKNYQFIQGDIASQADLKKLKKHKFDALVNYAAETHVDRSILSPLEFSHTNALGTHELLEFTRRGQAKKMIQISTDEVFGETQTKEFFEDSPMRPNSPYSASKAAGDLMCAAYVRTFKTPVIVAHSCNFYGPYQYPEKFIALSVTNLIQGKKIPIYGSGSNVREWIYTQDHCRAIDLLLHQAETGRVFNIGTQERFTNLEIAEIILKKFNLDKSRLEFIQDRPGHDFRYAVNSDKLKKLGWQPQTKFMQGIEQTIKWYQEHQSWWRKLQDKNYQQYYQAQYKAKGLS
ncbi:MAG: dTDP-glucose 4,6-dehydratase [Candidatus Moranbacteria bacterium]|nr:dTDP-glucose 4,6-dehydratase [Candidatus Moranbacteria bacterium]